MPPTGPLGSGPLWGGPFMGGGFRRRRGFNLLPMGGFGWGGGWGGMGGMGGMGGGGGLMGDLLAGGIGYMMGRRQQQYQQPQYQQPQYQQPPQQYQAPQYQPPQQYQQPQPQYQQPAGGVSNEALAQLRLLGQLRDSGRLTNDEFEAEKQRILHGQGM